MLEIMFLYGLEKVLLKMKKIKALDYANDYLGIHKRPVWIPIVRVQEGKEGVEFNKFIKK